MEDTHWIDPSTREFLEQLAHHVTDASVLILVTDRKQQTQFGGAHSYVTSITLNRLSRAQSKKIIQATGGAAFSNEITNQIVARADGVPLFVEELTRAVVEAAGEADQANIPETLHDSLMARLDRLGDAKEIAQISAVIGRDFGYNLLSAVVEHSADELANALEKMVRSELVSRRGVAPDTIYTFKHALVQSVALAAIGRSANSEAIVHLSTGLEILTEQPLSNERDAQELDFCLALGPALMSTKGLAAVEAEEVYLRAQALCQSVGHAALSFQATWGLWLVYQQRGQIDLAQTATNEVLSLAEQQKDNVDYLLQAHHAAWTTQLFVGNISASREHSIEGDAIYDVDKHRNHAFAYGGHDPGVCAKTTASEALFLLDHPEQAKKYAEDGVSLAGRLSHPFSLAMAHYFVAQVHQYCLEADAVRIQAQAAITMCQQHGFESFQAQATVLLGWATATNGQSDTGIAQIREGLTAWQMTGTGMRRPYFLALLADALSRANKIGEGLKTIMEAEALIKHAGETRWLAETVRLKGVLMEKDLLRMRIPRPSALAGAVT